MADSGIELTYREQPEPKKASSRRLRSVPDFIGDSSVCLILGDNVFYGHDLTGLLQESLRSAPAQRSLRIRSKTPSVMAWSNSQKMAARSD